MLACWLLHVVVTIVDTIASSDYSRINFLSKIRAWTDHDRCAEISTEEFGDLGVLLGC